MSQIQTFFPGPTAALARRGACVGQPLNPDGTCTVAVSPADVGEDFTQINGSTGLSALPRAPDKLRASGDVEFFSGDNVFFRITPRHAQDYRFRANYKAADWINLGRQFVSWKPAIPAWISACCTQPQLWV